MIEEKKWRPVITLAGILYIFLMTGTATCTISDSTSTAGITRLQISAADNIDLTVDAGFDDGIAPGTRLEITRMGVIIGWIHVKTADRNQCSGLFEPSCNDCKPELDDSVINPASTPSLPAPDITLPDGSEKSASPLSEEDADSLQNAFDAFLRGERKLIPMDNSQIDETPITPCPEMKPEWAGANEQDPDNLIETELFPAPGDWIRVSGHRENDVFCIEITDDGKPNLDEWQSIDMKDKTLARLEYEIAAEFPGEYINLDLTLLPADYIRRRLTVHILGNVEQPGMHEFEQQVDLKEALIKAGAAIAGGGAALLVTHNPDGGRVLKEITLPAGNDDNITDEHPENTLHDGDIIFMPESEKDSAAFTSEVLPYLKDSTTL